VPRKNRAADWTALRARDESGEERSAGFGAHFILSARATGYAERADDRHPAFDGDRVLQAQDEQPICTASEAFLKRLGRTLEDRRRSRFGYGDVNAADLGLVQLLQIYEIDSRLDRRLRLPSSIRSPALVQERPLPTCPIAPRPTKPTFIQISARAHKRRQIDLAGNQRLSPSPIRHMISDFPRIHEAGTMRSLRPSTSEQDPAMGVLFK